MLRPIEHRVRRNDDSSHLRKHPKALQRLKRLRDPLHGDGRAVARRPGRRADAFGARSGGSQVRCPNCGGGELKIIATILERLVVDKILTHQGLDPQPPPRVRVCEAEQDFAA